MDYRFVAANPAFEKQTGLHDAVGRTARELVPNLEAHWIETYGRVATTGESTRFQMGSDVMGRWFDVFAFRTGRPEERRVALLFTDVSAARVAARERERLLRALEVERSRLAAVFAQTPSVLAIVRGPEHVLVLANDAYLAVNGHRDVIGKPLLDAVPELRGQGFEVLLDRVVAPGESFVGREVPIWLSTAPGAAPGERFFDFVYLPLVEADESGRPTRVGVIAHGNDITEQVRARREVEQARAAAEAARDAAEAANRAKSEFLAVMSHELRTPLNAIGGYAELMELGLHGPLTAQQRDALARIQRSGRHLLGLINEVLNYAKIEAGAVAYASEPVRVADAVAAAEALVTPQLRAKGLGYTWAACDPDLTAYADPEKMQQILLNLLTNAVKFTDAHAGRPGQVEVSCGVADDGRVMIRVRDTGIGIPTDKLEVIFEPFVQVRADLTRTAEGAGLGLAISRDLARGMGGELTAESTPGVGSTFTLVLPRESRS